jgi:uncharacterized secreted protein with C-terminal beta-propeller domain
MRKNNKLKGFIVVGLLVCASLVAAVTLLSINKGGYAYALQTFSSYDELKDFFHKKYESYNSLGDQYSLYNRNDLLGASKESVAADGNNAEKSVDFSKTNVQVEGVDEPDIVKTDGTYLYVLANNKIYIIQAYPAEESTLLETIPFGNDVYVSNMFIYGDHLVVFGNNYVYPILYSDEMDISVQESWWDGNNNALISVYDVSDHSNPELLKEIKINGSYFDARLIGDYVYIVVTQPTYEIYQVAEDTETINIPRITIDNSSSFIPANDIYYVDVPELSDSMTHVLSLNLVTDEMVEKSFLLGSSQTMYVSLNSIFLASSHYPFLFVKSESTSSSNNEETTILHKISISNGDINYIAQGEVPGRILNQFSMDEHNGFFRIATTIGYTWETDVPSTNNIYILDENLKRVSQIEGLAPGESIYAVRFLGDRGYLVTFVQVDPLFTIDLSDPNNPKVLGELKIPGYSDYLHPFDENHIIGVGKEVNASIDADKIHTPGAVYYTAILGLKMALFDVTDIENPKEIAKIVIGDRGSDSPVLYDHKAFLFDREKELLVIPVSVIEIPESNIDYIWGKLSFQGAYVYRLSLENGFELIGQVTHRGNEDITDEDYSYYYNNEVTRTLFIDNVLYTISGSMVKMNSLSDLSEINNISLD